MSHHHEGMRLAGKTPVLDIGDRRLAANLVGDSPNSIKALLEVYIATAALTTDSFETSGPAAEDTDQGGDAGKVVLAVASPVAVVLGDRNSRSTDVTNSQLESLFDVLLVPRRRRPARVIETSAVQGVQPVAESVEDRP